MSTGQGASGVEEQILHAADVMLARYGANARFEAAMRAEELSDSGDTEGARLWRRVEVELICRHGQFRASDRDLH